MALIQLGAIVTKIAGKISGSTFSGNTSGSTLRTKLNPFKNTNALQSQKKSLWQFISNQWRTLAITEQQAWSLYALSFYQYNKLGEQIPPRGNHIFVGTNLFYYPFNGTILTQPLLFTTPNIVDGSTGTIRRNTQIARLQFDIVFGNTLVQVYASGPFTYGKQAQMKSRLRQMGSMVLIQNPGDIINFDTEFWSAYPWGRPSQYVWVAWRRIDPTCFSWSVMEYLLVRITN